MKRPCSGTAVLLTLSGCAMILGHSMGSARLNAPGQIRLPGKSGEHAVVIAYRAPGEYEEYQRATTRRAIAEALYMEANGVQTALDFSPFRLHALTRHQWKFNRPPARLQWRPAQLAPATNGGRHARITYARFTRHASSSRNARNCVAFIRAWAVPFDDPRQRPARAYFGYYCRAPGKSLGAAAARRYVTRIRSARRELDPVRYGQKVPTDASALEQARGASGGSVYGAPNFPLHRVVNYVDSSRRAQ